MKGRLTLLLVCCALALKAQMEMNVEQLVEFLRSEIALKQQTDKQIAVYLKKVRLTEQLPQKVIEDLEAQGAGPKTVDALNTLRGESDKLKPPGHDVTYSPSTANNGTDAAAGPPAVQISKAQPIPPPNSVKQAEILDSIKLYAKSYTLNLPNFVCVQVTRRYVQTNRNNSGDNYSSAGTVLTKVSYNEGHEDYKVYSVNNQYVDTTIDKVGGATSTGEFGSEMGKIFSETGEANFAWDHWATLRGRRMAVFSYQMDSGHADYRISDEASEVFTGLKGLVYADPNTGAIYRVTETSIDIPRGFSITAVSKTLDYDDVEINGHTYLCPLRAEVRATDTRAKWKLSLEFRAYRKYGTESSITYGDMSDAEANPLPASQTEEQPASTNSASKPPEQKPAPEKPAAASSGPFALPTPPPPPPQ